MGVVFNPDDVWHKSTNPQKKGHWGPLKGTCALCQGGFFLTNREAEILALYAGGLQGPNIAETLHITMETVRTHTNNIRRALHAKTVAHCVAVAMRAGILK